MFSIHTTSFFTSTKPLEVGETNFDYNTLGKTQITALKSAPIVQKVPPKVALARKNHNFNYFQPEFSRKGKYL